jgi:ABC-2 type transport system ATP-binding protein
LLVVDEPTAGLDPEERIRFRNLLGRISGDRTVILSTHIVGDIEASCAAVAVLSRGRVAFNGAPEALIAHAEGRVWSVEIAASEWERLESQYRVTASRQQGNMLTARVISSAPGENPWGRGLPLQPGLEDGYIAVMGGEFSGERTRFAETVIA